MKVADIPSYLQLNLTSALENISLEELQEMVENLKLDLGQLVRFVSDQEDELILQCQAIAELEDKLKRAGEYERLSLEMQLSNERERQAMLEATLVGQRRNLRKREAIFNRHWRVLRRRQRESGLARYSQPVDFQRSPLSPESQPSPISWETSEPTDWGYGHLLATFWRRRFWFLSVFLGTLAVAVPMALSKKPVYQSSLQLLVEPNYQSQQQNSGDGLFNIPRESQEIDYATQLNLMRSSGLIQQALDNLKAEYPSLTVKAVKKSLSLSQVQEDEVATKIFQVDYTSDNGIESQKVLQAIQKVYLEYNLEQQRKRLSDGLGFINKQLPLARQSLLAAENALKEFRTRNNLIAPEQEAATVSESLSNVARERETMQAQYREIQVRYQEIQAKLGVALPDSLISSRLSESYRYQNLLNRIQLNEILLAEQKARYTESSPMVQELREQQQNLKQLLHEEMLKVLKKLPANFEGTLRNAGQLGQIDLKMVNDLLEAQLNLIGLQARDRSLAKTEQQLRADLNRFPKLISQYNSLLQEVQVKQATLQQLLQARQDLGIELNRGGFNWQVVESPELGERVDRLSRSLLIGGVLALFLGGIAAFLREVTDDTLRLPEQLKQQSGFPLLGSTPQWQPAREVGLGAALAALPAPMARLGSQNLAGQTEVSPLQLIQWQPFRESLDFIYKNLQRLHPSGALNSLMVTSAAAGEGKSTLVLGLALSAARSHQRVLVIDANLRQPTLHAQFDLPNQEGLSTLLSGKTDRPKPHPLVLAGLEIDLLVAGPVPEDPMQLLSGRQMEELMQGFEQSYDLVLLDSPALLRGVDAIQLAACAKGVVMVARLDRLKRSDLTQAIALLNPLMPMGMVANGSA
jgi:capsular exopolysaccharide synthesis family protein